MWDFATPVSQVEVFPPGNDTLFELSVSSQFDYRYDQADKMFIARGEETGSHRQRQAISGQADIMNFQDIPARTVLTDHRRTSTISTW